MKPAKRITEMLADLHDGDVAVASELMPMVYAKLRRIAAAHFRREKPGHTLRATELLHETYLKLIKPGTGPWKSREHFFGVASRAMREMLIDYARARVAEKRGGKIQRVDISKAVVYPPKQLEELLDLDSALKRLEKRSRRQSRIVELRFFGGLTNRETASQLHLSVTTVKEEWALAKAWLQREMSGGV
jgi:RNA polymerase sigma-70 factor (ECF subfamily)